MSLSPYRAKDGVVMGRDEGLTRTVATVLAEYRAACRVSKAESMPPKARKKAHWALYVEAVTLGAEPDALDAATLGGEVKYDVSAEPLVIAANDAIRKRGRGVKGKAWKTANAKNETAKAAFIDKRDSYKLTKAALQLAHVALIGGEDVSIPNKGKDGASLPVSFTPFVDDDGKIDVSNGGTRGDGSSTGDIVWATESYRKAFTKGHKRCKAANEKNPVAATLDVTVLALGTNGVPNSTRVDVIPDWFDGEYTAGETYDAHAGKILNAVAGYQCDARREFKVIARR